MAVGMVKWWHACLTCLSLWVLTLHTTNRRRIEDKEEEREEGIKDREGGRQRESSLNQFLS